jgi:hypothetical protein
MKLRNHLPFGWQRPELNTFLVNEMLLTLRYQAGILCSSSEFFVGRYSISSTPVSSRLRGKTSTSTA